VSSVILGVEQSDVVQGGQITLTQLFETYIGSGQGASASGVQIGITAATTPGAGSGTPVVTTSAGITSPNDANFSYAWACPASQATGDYLVTWTGIVSGVTLTYVQTVTVAARATGSPAPGVYATWVQYQNWSGDYFTPQTVVTPMIARASEDIDSALTGAVYPVDANGMPADAMVIGACMRATCAQVQFLLADNDPAGVKRQYAQTNIGGVQATRVAAMTALALPPLSPRAAQILHSAGVLPSAALINW